MKLIITSLLFSLCVNGSLDRNNLFKGKTEIENPFELRDPFLPPNFKSEVIKKIESKKSDGNFSNIPQLNSDFDLSKLRIVGVLIGKERRALAKIGESKNTFVLKEGMFLGDSGELKAIVPGGIILVEKSVNIYGEEEYLETVIPISR